MGGIVGAIAGPALGIIGGILGGNSASDTQANAATTAAQIGANSQMAGLQFVAGQEAPYNQAGQLALSRYEQLLGLGGGGGASMGGGGGQQWRPTPGGGVQQILSNGPSGGPRAVGGPGGGGFDLNSFLSNTPGYQFELGQGLNAIENSAASRGGALTGNTLQGEQAFGQGLASQNFNQYMQQLAGLTGMGQAAASGVAGAGQSLIPGAGASLASGINAAGQYNAAGQMNLFNQLGSGLTTAFNAPSVQGGLQSLFGGQSGIDPSALAAGIGGF